MTQQGNTVWYTVFYSEYCCWEEQETAMLRRVGTEDVKGDSSGRSENQSAAG